MKPVAHYRSVLETRLAELETRLHRIEDSLDQPRNADLQEAATEREDDEVKEELGQTGLDEIRAIRAALQRIEDGTYGICINTGEPIPEARLDAVPYAATVVQGS
ncbi:MAG: TraR/DksA C4-type zinc finger protein [Pseudomonadota bacterium]